MGKTFKPQHIHSIYKKGLIRQNRLNTEVEVERDIDIKHYTSKDVDIYVIF